MASKPLSEILPKGRAMGKSKGEQKEEQSLRMLTEKEFWERMCNREPLDQDDPDYYDKLYEITKGFEEVKMQEKW